MVTTTSIMSYNTTASKPSVVSTVKTIMNPSEANKQVYLLNVVR
jgi:hypothetical protein